MVTRRAFLRGAASLAAIGAVFPSRRAAADEPPETTRLRLAQIAGLCVAPQYIASEFLKLEGFKDVEYVTIPDTKTFDAFAAGDVDLSMAFVAPFLVDLDGGVPIV